MSAGMHASPLTPLPVDAASPVDYAETERALLVLLACPDLDTALTPPHTTTQAGQVMAASAAPLDPSMQLFTMPSFPAHLPTASASSAADSKASMDVSSPADIHGNMSQLPAYAYTPAGRLLDHGQLQAVSSQQQAVVAAAALVARAVSSALVIAYPTQPPSAEAQEAGGASALQLLHPPAHMNRQPVPHFS